LREIERNWSDREVRAAARRGSKIAIGLSMRPHLRLKNLKVSPKLSLLLLVLSREFQSALALRRHENPAESASDRVRFLLSEHVPPCGDLLAACLRTRTLVAELLIALSLLASSAVTLNNAQEIILSNKCGGSQVVIGIWKHLPLAIWFKRTAEIREKRPIGLPDRCARYRAECKRTHPLGFRPAMTKVLISLARPC